MSQPSKRKRTPRRPFRENIESFAALLGLAGVALGAYGAHGLEALVGAAQLETWRTAAHYHQLHAVAMLVAGLLVHRHARAARAAAIAFAVGIALFSGSLYALVLGAPRGLGVVTPFGGLAFMLGWSMLAVAGLRDESEPDAANPAIDPPR